MGELLNADQEFLPIDEVRAIQSLAMGVLSEKARRKVFKDKMTGYVLYESTGEPMGSNAVDTFMGVISKKPAINYWQFTVSFLSGMMNDRLRYSNTRELYRFNWNNLGCCVGTKILTDNYNPVVSTRYDIESGIIDTVEPNIESWWRPIDVADFDDLSERMLHTAAQVEMNRPKKFGADWRFTG